MKCPFFMETNVLQCRASAFRKMIVQSPGQDSHGRCSSAGFAECELYREQLHNEFADASCPFLEESAVQYCSAAPVTKFIPYSESILSRCGNDGYRYCSLYLGMAQPAAIDLEAERAAPEQLYYSPNHMWLDRTVEGNCHVGVDALLAKALGAAERIAFMSSQGVERPAAVLTVNGLDWQMMFPNRIHISSPNYYLRAEPAKIMADPYGAGWLFEGTEEPGSLDGLITGADASEWMRQESARLTKAVHDWIATPEPGGARLVADGGDFAPGFAKYMDRESLLKLFHSFFSPLANWR
jgi:glycine cleavage system H lipoate-binding protein